MKYSNYKSVKNIKFLNFELKNFKNSNLDIKIIFLLIL